MNISVRLFGSLRALSPESSVVDVPIRTGTTAAELKLLISEILSSAGGASELIGVSAVGTEEDILPDHATIPDGVLELVLLPPVSGG